MKTKSGKSHWKCATVWERDGYETRIDNDFRFVAFDGKAHMETIKAKYGQNVRFSYHDLVNLDE